MITNVGVMTTCYCKWLPTFIVLQTYWDIHILLQDLCQQYETWAVKYQPKIILLLKSHLHNSTMKKIEDLCLFHKSFNMIQYIIQCARTINASLALANFDLSGVLIFSKQWIPIQRNPQCQSAFVDMIGQILRWGTYGLH